MERSILALCLTVLCSGMSCDHLIAATDVTQQQIARSFVNAWLLENFDELATTETEQSLELIADQLVQQIFSKTGVADSPEVWQQIAGGIDDFKLYFDSVEGGPSATAATAAAAVDNVPPIDDKMLLQWKETYGADKILDVLEKLAVTVGLCVSHTNALYFLEQIGVMSPSSDGGHYVFDISYDNLLAAIMRKQDDAKWSTIKAEVNRIASITDPRTLLRAVNDSAIFSDEYNTGFLNKILDPKYTNPVIQNIFKKLLLTKILMHELLSERVSVAIRGGGGDSAKLSASGSAIFVDMRPIIDLENWEKLGVDEQVASLKAENEKDNQEAKTTFEESMARLEAQMAEYGTLPPEDERGDSIKDLQAKYDDARKAFFAEEYGADARKAANEVLYAADQELQKAKFKAGYKAQKAQLEADIAECCNSATIPTSEELAGRTEQLQSDARAFVINYTHELCHVAQGNLSIIMPPKPFILRCKGSLPSAVFPYVDEIYGEHSSSLGIGLVWDFPSEILAILGQLPSYYRGKPVLIKDNDCENIARFLAHEPYRTNHGGGTVSSSSTGKFLMHYNKLNEYYSSQVDML